MDTFDSGISGQRLTIFAIIVIFHIALIYGLNSSLSRIVIERVFGPIKTDILEEILPEDNEPPPPPPRVETPPPFVPPPDIAIDLPVDTGPSRAIQVVTNTPKPATPPPAAPSVRTTPEIDPKFKRRFQPDYPPTSRRLGEEGSVILQVLVGPDGAVQDAKVQTSSGYPRLDEAALNHAKRAWKFTPGTEDGKAVTMWHSVKVTFRITG